MRQDYVIYNGVKYNSGDAIHILWYTNGYKNVRNYTGIFVDCDEEKDEYRFTVDGQLYCFNKVCFWRTIRNNPISETYYVNKEPRKATFKNELNIDGLLIAWIWYIFIMVLLVIFNDRIVGWIGTSIIFFNYRKKKLREAGFKK